MDCHGGSGFAGRHVVEFQCGNSGNGINEDWDLGFINQATWATEDGICNKETSHSDSKLNHEGRPFQFEVGSEPRNRRAKNSLLVDLAASDRTEAIGTMFYKTKICKKFRAGVCPFIRDCNFAHSVEELRKPPPNWQEVVVAHKVQQVESSEPREVIQIPIVGFDEVTKPEGPNVRQARQHCRDYLSEVGCQFGDNCIFIHDEHYKERQSVAICLLPGTAGGYESSRSKLTLNAPNWKTRICNKWESTGFCAYNRNCHFAHGFAELQPYGGGLVKGEAEGSSTIHANQVTVPAKASVGAADTPVPLVPYSYRIGASSRTLPNVTQHTGEIAIRRWKGPNKISKIYGDWIDDL